MSEQYEEGSSEWFLARDGGTEEELALKRKAYSLMEKGEYDAALRILWKHFPDQYPVPEKERDHYPEYARQEPEPKETDN